MIRSQSCAHKIVAGGILAVNYPANWIEQRPTQPRPVVHPCDMPTSYKESRVFMTKAEPCFSATEPTEALAYMDRQFRRGSE